MSGASSGFGAGVVSTSLLGAAVGLAVTLVVYSGVNVWRAYKEKTKNPYQFLSRVEKAGAILTLPPQVKKK
jgi:hypothetical protein